MSKLRKHRPSPALIVASLALLVALSGTSYATVLQVPRNSVGTLQLKRNAVTSSKLAPNSVRAGQVVNGSLLVVDFKEGQIPQGPKGDKGDKGDRGQPGPTEGVAASDASPALPTTLANQWGGDTDTNSTFTTSRSGKLLLMKSVVGNLDCAQSGGTAWWWLTVDGSSVAGSFRLLTLAPGVFESITLMGVTEQAVPAGAHTLGASAMCRVGSSGGSSYNVYSAGSAVVLG